MLYAHGVKIKAWDLFGAYWQVTEKNLGAATPRQNAVLTQHSVETLTELGVSRHEASDAVFLHWLSQAKPELFSKDCASAFRAADPREGGISGKSVNTAK